MGDRPRLRIVVSSSPEDAPWRAHLLEHLRVLERFRNVEVWSDADVEGGADWRAIVDRELGRADVALLLVSSAYLASDHLQDVEVPQLFERHKAGGVQVIPVLVRSCAWELHPWIGTLLPEGQRPVATFEGDGRDRALADVVKEIARRVGVDLGGAAKEEPRERGWAWHGSPGSAERGVISVLALAETVAAMAVYGYVAVRYGTLHLTVSACIAPLLLLRTPQSQQRGLKYGMPLVGRLTRTLAFPSATTGPSLRHFLETIFVLVKLVPMFACISISVVIVRFISGLQTFCTEPLTSIRAVPINWWRTVACVDTDQVPAPLPGVETDVIDNMEAVNVWSNPVLFLQPVKITEFASNVSYQQTPILILATLTFIPRYIIVFIPAWLYRWALKGTAILYSPLVWLAHSTFREDLRDRLEDLQKVALYRLVRAYSSFVLLALAVRLGLDLLIPSWPSLWAGHHAAPILNAVLAPHALPFWQIAVATNAVGAWALYLYADWVLARINRGRVVDESRVDSIIRTVWLLRGALSIYVIGNGIRAAASLAGPLPAWAHLPWRP